MDSQVDSQNLTSLLFGMDKGFFFLKDNKAGQRSFIVTLPTIGFIYHVWVTVTGGRIILYQKIKWVFFHW
jgi:hypothetical protein